MKKLYNSRSSCRLCLSKKIKKVVNVGLTPIADKYVNKNNKKNFHEVPLDLYICKQCGHVQLIHIVNPDYLWKNFSFKTGEFNYELIEHFRKIFLKLRKKNIINRRDLILDIGSNDGSFLKIFKRNNFKNILGIDPSKKIVQFANRSNLRTIIGYFNYENSIKISQKFGKPKIITSFNSFAHSDDIRGIVKGIKNILHKEGVFVFKVSYLLDVIKKRLLGTIFHEHLDYHSVTCLKNFLKNYNLDLFEVERNNYQGGSIIGYVQHTGGKFKNKIELKKLLAYEQKLKLNSTTNLKKFNEDLINEKKKIFSLLKKLKLKGNKIVGFGASRSSITFFNYFKIGKFISSVFDENKLKIKKYYPKTNTQILQMKKMNEDEFNYIIVLAWLHTNRVIKNLKKRLSDKVKFISIYPKVKISNN